MSGYEILSLDDVERFPGLNEAEDRGLMLPLRHLLGLRAFGANAWTAEAGKPVVPHHVEDSGDEELYVVVRGRARFTVDGETLDAPAGMLVHVLAGQTRVAIAEEPGTIVLAVGATPGEAFLARGWDDVVVAFGLARSGRPEEGRAALQQALDRRPADWEGAYNLACFEALYGDRDGAFAELARAAALGPPELREFAAGDDDLAALRDDPRWQELLG